MKGMYIKRVDVCNNISTSKVVSEVFIVKDIPYVFTLSGEQIPLSEIKQVSEEVINLPDEC